MHRRASAWYEQHDLPVEAVQHALAVPDVELAARLIEPMALPIAFQGQISTVLGWLNALPEALVRTRPFLCVYYARLLMFTNQLEAAEARLQEAERGVQEEMPAEQARIIQGWVLATRAGIAGLSGDLPHAIPLARQALELLPEAEVIPRVGAIVTAARAYQVSGDVTPATEHEVAAAVALIRASDNLFAIVGSITSAGASACPAGQAPAGRRHLCPGGAGGPTTGGVANHVQPASTTISAWATCCASGTSWMRLSGTWHKAWHWSKRH